MKGRYKILVCTLVSGLLGAGCDDFLEEQSQEKQYAKNCNDLDEVLVGDGYMHYTVFDADNRADFGVLPHVRPELGALDDGHVVRRGLDHGILVGKGDVHYEQITVSLSCHPQNN